MKVSSVFVMVLGFVVLYGSSANAQGAGAPLMTIKIYNSSNENIFPVLTMGKDPKDEWLQAFFKIADNKLSANPYPRGKNFRIYINPPVPWCQGNPQQLDCPIGIPPGESVTLTLPLYTQLATTVDPMKEDQYIDWWKGGTILIYNSGDPASYKALVDAYLERTNQDQKPLDIYGKDPALIPQCTGSTRPVGCLLNFYSDTADLPKRHPMQLLEYTLGDKIDLKPPNPNNQRYDLDTENVDFDVSYVNYAYMPAVMGTYQNKHVGYVGTPQSIDEFRRALNKFLDNYKGWPQFVDGAKQKILKVPSPLEIFAQVSGANQPTDFTELPKVESGQKWQDKLWPPIQELKEKWVQYSQSCQPTQQQNTFCDAIYEINKLFEANYKSYIADFSKGCTGTPIPKPGTLNLLKFIYGWTPFTEAVGGTCKPTWNQLYDTPGYKENNSKEYRRVKDLFDKLNYGVDVETRQPYFRDAKYD